MRRFYLNTLQFHASVLQLCKACYNPLCIYSRYIEISEDHVLITVLQNYNIYLKLISYK